MKVLENFIWLQFADDIDMDLRKRISQEFEERYDKARYTSFNEFIKGKVFDIQEVWKARIKNDVIDIKNNPSQKTAHLKLSQWQRLSYVNQIVTSAYIKIMIELLANFSSSKAYNYFYKKIDKKSYFKPELGFQWQPNIKRLAKFFFHLKENNLIENETNYETFKRAFSGIILSKMEPIKFTCSNPLVVYLFFQLQKDKFINGKLLKSNRIVEYITGIENVAKVRYNYEKSKKGKPINSNTIDSILKDL